MLQNQWFVEYYVRKYCKPIVLATLFEKGIHLNEPQCSPYEFVSFCHMMLYQLQVVKEQKNCLKLNNYTELILWYALQESFTKDIQSFSAKTWNLYILFTSLCI